MLNDLYDAQPALDWVEERLPDFEERRQHWLKNNFYVDVMPQPDACNVLVGHVIENAVS